MRYEFILLDADGTLFDFDRAERQSFAATCEAHGIASGPSLYERYHTLNKELWRCYERGELDQPTLRRRRFELLFAETGATADPDAFNRDYTRGLARGTDLIDGALELCRELHRHSPLYIATNGLPDVQRARLEHCALAPYIDRMFVSGELGCQKPDPAYFEEVFSRLGIGDEEKRRTILLGDSLTSDMRGGRAAEIATCWFAPPDAPGDGSYDFRISRLEEFLPIVLD